MTRWAVSGVASTVGPEAAANLSFHNCDILDKVGPLELYDTPHTPLTHPINTLYTPFTLNTLLITPPTPIIHPLDTPYTTFIRLLFTPYTPPLHP